MRRVKLYAFTRKFLTMIKTIPLFLLTAWLLAACQPIAAPSTASPSPATATPAPTITPSPAPTQPPLRIEVDPADLRQTLRDVGGGNFIHKFAQISQALDPIGQYNVDAFRPKVIRIRMALEDWEPANDNDDPAAFAWEAFLDSGATRGAFESLGVFQSQKGLPPSEIALIASAWDVPGWVTQNPSAERGRIIPSKNYPELIEMIAAWLLRAKDVYGVEVDYISFNEPNIGVNVSLLPGELIALIRQAGPRFAELGLKTRWLIGDCSNMDGCLDYIKPMWEAEDIRPYLGPAAFHSWDQYTEDDKLERIAAYAAQNHLEVWCTEAGWDPFLWQTPEAFPKWNNAIQLGMIYTRVLKHTGASAMLYWEMLGKDYQINDGGQPFAVMNVLKQFDAHFPAGSQIAATSRDDFILYSVAAKTPGGFTLAIVHLRISPNILLVDGLPQGEYTLVEVTEAGVNPEAGQFRVTGQTLEIPLAASSVNFLVRR
jgi:hypothetical protein